MPTLRNIFAACACFAATSVAVSNNNTSCDEGDNCWDMRMQSVSGCTDGWTLHVLWPQWAESCTSEAFDISQVQSIEDDLNEFWPSCEGSASSFWSHEWKKHGTCSNMTQLTYFQTALEKVKQYRTQCSGTSGPCNVCFQRNLSSSIPCNE